MQCNKLGNPGESLEVVSEPLPRALEYGEVLITILAAPINPADMYNVKAGTAPTGVRAPLAQPQGPLPRHTCAMHVTDVLAVVQSDAEPLKLPFIAGNDCIGVVTVVGPGVKNLKENDWVMPMKAGMGTWRSMAVWMEKDLRKLPSADLLPVEYAAMLRACPRRAARV